MRQAVLQKIASDAAVETRHLRHLAQLSLDCHNRELGRLALEKALARLVQPAGWRVETLLTDAARRFAVAVLAPV